MNEIAKYYTVRVARTTLGELLIIDSDQDWAIDSDGFEFSYDITQMRTQPYERDDLDFWLEGTDLIPKERGIYECKVLFEQWQSNHPLDPVEYDTSATITECRKLI